jgi:hypothetical protein
MPFPPPALPDTYWRTRLTQPPCYGVDVDWDDANGVPDGWQLCCRPGGHQGPHQPCPNAVHTMAEDYYEPIKVEVIVCEHLSPLTVAEAERR